MISPYHFIKNKILKKQCSMDSKIRVEFKFGQLTFCQGCDLIWGNLNSV